MPSDEPARIIPEEPWHDSLEKEATELEKEALTLSQIHEKAGYLLGGRRNFVELPAILIPIVMSPVSFIIEKEAEGGTGTINSTVFLLAGVLAAVNKYFDFARRSELHFNMASRYEELSLDVKAELARRREHRQAADVFIQKINLSLQYMNRNAPTLPKAVLSNGKPRTLTFSKIGNPLPPLRQSPPLESCESEVSLGQVVVTPKI